MEEQDQTAPTQAEDRKLARQQARQQARQEKRQQKENKKAKGGAGKKGAPDPVVVEVRPAAQKARMRTRHWSVLFSFFLCVVAPAAATYWYLHERAVDQYASTIGFSVRTEEIGSAIELLGGISQISSGSSSDTDILYEFIQSQNMVEKVDEKLDLRAIYTKPENDPVFALKDDAALEELVGYWNRMIKIAYDGATGLIQVRVQAFDAADAQNIAQAIFDESSVMINELSAIAREDATRYAKEELDEAVARLKEARQNITAFRNKAQIVDPNADIQGQMGLLNTLQTQLAEALIEMDLLRETARAGDPRLIQAQRRISVIEARIGEERKKLGVGTGEGSGGEAYATLISEYEGLVVEREFAEQSYLAALKARDTAQAEAQRQSRYLAAYVRPTLAQTPEYPQRLLIFALVTGFILILWAIAVLIYYSIKDRR